MNRTKSTPPPIPQGYRLIRRHATQEVRGLPGDLWWDQYSRVSAWQPWPYGAIPSRGSYGDDLFIRPADPRRQRQSACCAHCGQSRHRQGMGCGESAVVPVKLWEISPGRLVCSRCIGSTKGQVTRHFNLIRRLGGTPSYEGRYVTTEEAARRHVKAVLA